MKFTNLILALSACLAAPAQADITGTVTTSLAARLPPFVTARFDSQAQSFDLQRYLGNDQPLEAYRLVSVASYVWDFNPLGGHLNIAGVWERSFGPCCTLGPYGSPASYTLSVIADTPNSFSSPDDLIFANGSLSFTGAGVDIRAAVPILIGVRTSVAHVPEPTTWALLAAGLGLLGMMKARRP